MALFAGDALRMELDAVDRQARVAKPLDGAVGGAGGDDQRVRQAVRRQRQAVIAGRLEGRGQAGEDAAAVMRDFARPCHASAPARARSGLRNAGRSPGGRGRRRAGACRASAQARDQASETPASSGLPGPGEIRTAAAPLASASSGGQRVVALDPDRAAELAQILDQVPGEAVIIVDDQDQAGVDPVIAAAAPGRWSSSRRCGDARPGWRRCCAGRRRSAPSPSAAGPGPRSARPG